jgi:hypothetical protein
MHTLKGFIEASSVDASLIRAVVRQVGGWDSFREMASDVANHGAGSGFSGFTYYSDTVSFAKRNKSAILDYAKSMAQDIGEPGAYSLIAGFTCLKDLSLGADGIAEAINMRGHEDETQVFNALAWFALEEVSRAYVDATEYA